MQRTILLLGSASDRARAASVLEGTCFALGCEIELLSQFLRTIRVDRIVVLARESPALVARVERGIAGTRLTMDDVVFVHDPALVSGVLD